MLRWHAQACTGTWSLRCSEEQSNEYMNMYAMKFITACLQTHQPSSEIRIGVGGRMAYGRSQSLRDKGQTTDWFSVRLVEHIPYNMQYILRFT